MESSRARSRRSFTCKEPGCGRSFLRQEHLQRHHLNHEPEEIFSCDICPKSFVRQDLYRRHKARHEKGMFFRNTGGIVNSSSSPASSLNRKPHCVEDGSGLIPGDLNDNSSEHDHEQFQVSADLTLDPLWTGWTQHHGVQDDLDWCFDLGDGSNDPGNPSISQFDIDLLMNIELPMLYRSENHGTESMPERDKPDPVPNNSQQDEWLTARSSLLDSLSQLDPGILESPFFNVDNLRMFYAAYFKHYNPHFPILHQPTLSVAGCEPLLLTAILDLGSTMVSDNRLFLLGQQIHNSLRLIIINSGMFEAPIPLWCLQALLLVQAYGKMISSRKHYEMAHIFHGAILTMMKRGSVYLAASTSRPPQPTDSVQQAWFGWISEESWRRTAFLAFIMDAQHACVFGHNPVLSVSDMRMALPCPESWWECTSADNWLELKAKGAQGNSSLTENGSATASFLPTLKSIIRGDLIPPNCSEYGRFILLHGLMSLQTHLHAGSRLTLGLGAGNFHPKDSMTLMDGGRDPSSTEIPMKPWITTISSALNSWSTCLFSLQPSLCLEAARPLHRIAYITLHVNVVDIHTMAVDRNRLDGFIARRNYDKTRARIQRWCFTDSAREAFRHALLLVQETMFSGHLYQARDDNIAPRPWCLYIAVLFLWIYGVITEGELHNGADNAKAEEYIIRITSALQRGLKSPVGANQTAGLISAVRTALNGCRWELLQEAHHVLGRLSSDSANDPGITQNMTLI